MNTTQDIKDLIGSKPSLSKKDKELFELRAKKEKDRKEDEEKEKAASKKDLPRDWESLYKKLRYEDSPETSIEDVKQNRD